MTDRQRSPETGTSDEHYNLISVLYHALQGWETYGKYKQDAEQSGDRELAEFFTQTQEEEWKRAARAKELLSTRLGKSKSR